MKLLKTALLIVLLTTTSAKPIRRYHDADIADKDHVHGFLAGVNRHFALNMAEDSSESSESQSSESSESSESTEVVTDQPTLVVTTIAMPPLTSGDGSTFSPEPDTMNTDGTVIMVVNTTPSPETMTPTGDVTSPCTQCFTVEIPTSAPVTESRGDN